MTSANNSSTANSPAGPNLLLMLLVARTVEQARDEVNTFVEWCLTDPAGRPLCQADVHRQLQAFLSEQRTGLVELPRDHGKSTQVCARVVWELARDPSLRVKIVCGSEALAAERGRFVRELIETNPRVRLVFPHLEPARPWSDTRLTITRPASVIGPSLTALGVGAASTGARADLLVCDDIVDVKAMTSRADRDRVKNRFRDNLMNLLEPDGRFWGLCTPWHRDDLNAELKRSEAYPLFRRAVGDELEPVWPERWPSAALAARLAAIGPAPFARAYRLIPLADDQVLIHASKVQYWTTPLAEPDRVILSVDPAVSINPRADRSALVVLARQGNDIHCLGAKADRVSTTGLIDMIDKADKLWNPTEIVFEGVGGFRGVGELMQKTAPFGPKVRIVSPAKDKGTRAAWLVAPVENGSLRLKGDGCGGVDRGQRELLDELTTFPTGEHDDLVDAAATGVAHLIGRREMQIR